MEKFERETYEYMIREKALYAKKRKSDIAQEMGLGHITFNDDSDYEYASSPKNKH